jgi:hypothetical protein
MKMRPSSTAARLLPYWENAAGLHSGRPDSFVWGLNVEFLFFIMGGGTRGHVVPPSRARVDAPLFHRVMAALCSSAAW